MSKTYHHAQPQESFTPSNHSNTSPAITAIHSFCRVWPSHSNCLFELDIFNRSRALFRPLVQRQDRLAAVFALAVVADEFPPEVGDSSWMFIKWGPFICWTMIIPALRLGFERIYIYTLIANGFALFFSPGSQTMLVLDLVLGVYFFHCFMASCRHLSQPPEDNSITLKASNVYQDFGCGPLRVFSAAFAQLVFMGMFLSLACEMVAKCDRSTWNFKSTVVFMLSIVLQLVAPAQMGGPINTEFEFWEELLRMIPPDGLTMTAESGQPKLLSRRTVVFRFILSTVFNQVMYAYVMFTIPWVQIAYGQDNAMAFLSTAFSLLYITTIDDLEGVKMYKFTIDESDSD